MTPAVFTEWMDITAPSPTNHPTKVSSNNSTTLILPLAFWTVLVLVITGHALYRARTWPRSWCRFGKQSQGPLYQEGCWTSGTISEFLPLTFHSFGFRLSTFPLSTMVSGTGPMEWPRPFLSMLCLNQHVQDHLQLLPEAHLGVSTKRPWCPWCSGERSGIPATYPAPQTKPGWLLHTTESSYGLCHEQFTQ